MYREELALNKTTLMLVPGVSFDLVLKLILDRDDDNIGMLLF